jgi:hypothetical protein
LSYSIVVTLKPICSIKNDGLTIAIRKIFVCCGPIWLVLPGKEIIGSFLFWSLNEATESKASNVHSPLNAVSAFPIFRSFPIFFIFSSFDRIYGATLFRKRWLNSTLTRYTFIIPFQWQQVTFW